MPTKDDVARLEAERLRPPPPPPQEATITELLDELIGVLATLLKDGRGNE